VHDYGRGSLLIQSQRCLAACAQLKADVSAGYHLQSCIQAVVISTHIWACRREVHTTVDGCHAMSQGAIEASYLSKPSEDGRGTSDLSRVAALRVT